MSVDEILAERDKTHGNWTKQSQCAQSFKAVVRRSQEPMRTLSKQQWEALDMILVKASRICSGDPNNKDHWIDIEGYARLGRDSDPL